MLKRILSHQLMHCENNRTNWQYKLISLSVLTLYSGYNGCDCDICATARSFLQNSTTRLSSKITLSPNTGVPWKSLASRITLLLFIHKGLLQFKKQRVYKRSLQTADTPNWQRNSKAGEESVSLQRVSLSGTQSFSIHQGFKQLTHKRHF